MMNKLYLNAVVGLVIALVCASCDLKPAIPMPHQPPCQLDAGTSIPLVATEEPGGEIILEWSASAGEFTPKKGSAVTYTAPKGYVGDVVIELTTKRGNRSEKEKLTCTVSALPTATPTITPEPTATIPPSTSTPTPPPPPLLEIFPQVGDGEKFVFMNSGGILGEKYASDEVCIRSGVYGLWLSYDMKGSGSGGWGVSWNNTPFNATNFTSLTFWIKGISGGENGFQIGIKDADEKEVKVETKDLTVINSDWVPMEIPLSKFDPVNLAAVRNINFGFNKDHGSGIICIDEIAFK